MGTPTTVAAALPEILRSATRTLHLRIEQRLNVEHGHWTRDRYAGFLKGTLAVVAPTEAAIERHLRPYFAAPDEPTAASTRLTRDLEALGVDRTPRPLASVPDIASAAHAFGAAYVLEGSRLGGQLIARVLTHRLGLDAGQLTYLAGNAAAVGARWRAFRDSLEAYGRTVDCRTRDLAAATALATFAAFDEAFTHEGVLDAV
jgi:heme oxygenase